MTEPSPHIGIAYVEEIAASNVDEFVSSIESEGLRIKKQSRENFDAFMGLEWLMPTAVAVYFFKPYFEAFLSAAGKSHYEILSKSLGKLTEKYFGKNAPHATVVSAGGEAKRPSGKFSLTYSVLIQVEVGVTLKLLIPSDASPKEASNAARAFLALASDPEAEGQIEGLESARPIGGTAWIQESSAT